MFQEIESLLTKAIEEFDKTIRDAGESLCPREFTAINNKMSTEANDLGRDKMKSILDVQLFLSDVKDTVKTIRVVLNPAIEIINVRSKRLTEVKYILSGALEMKFKSNDSELNVNIVVLITQCLIQLIFNL